MATLTTSITNLDSINSALINLGQLSENSLNYISDFNLEVNNPTITKQTNSLIEGRANQSDTFSLIGDFEMFNQYGNYLTIESFQYRYASGIAVSLYGGYVIAMAPSFDTFNTSFTNFNIQDNRVGYGVTYNFTGSFTLDGVRSINSLTISMNNISVTLTGNFHETASGVDGVINEISINENSQSARFTNINLTYSNFDDSTSFTNLSSIILNQDDTVIGTSDNNIIFAYAGNDMIQSGDGNDTIDGGLGFDVSIHSGNSTDYHFNFINAKQQLTVEKNSDNSIDVLVNIERLQFDNKFIDMINGLEYIAANSDLIQAFGNNQAAGITHYFNTGNYEGRSVSFDGLEYIASYSDLIAAFGSDATTATKHYIGTGFGEGRSVSFDGLEYIASYSDLIAAFGSDATTATKHYIGTGFGEGRSVSFDGLEYIASYSDLIAAFGSDATTATKHYIGTGFGEGRSITFDAEFYLAKYNDLRAAFGDDQIQGTLHYIASGSNEGRVVSNAGNDVLIGSDGNNHLYGGLGQDVMTGNGGADTFVFKSIAESTVANSDTIIDFSSAQGDKIDLSAIDAIAGGSNDAFTFTNLGASAFTATGQLRLDGDILYGNTTGDINPDFAIDLNGLTTLTSADFIL